MFAANGLLLPYGSLYLHALGFDPRQIGLLLALGFATKLFAPPLWGWLADYSGRRLVLIRVACIAATLSVAGVIPAGDWLPGVALALLFYHLFWNAVLPQFEALTLSWLGAAAHRYGRVRLWGSLGFVVTVLLFGAGLERLGPGALPPLLLALLTAVCVSALWVPALPSQTVPAAATAPPLGTLLRRPPVVALLAVAVLVQASHGPYYAFFSIQTTTLGYSGGAVGLLWTLGVAAEIGVFLLAPSWLAHADPRRLLLLTLALTALRWLLTGLCADRALLLGAAQLLHGFSYGLHHLVSIQLIHRWFYGRVQGRGQALFSSLSFGVGGTLGSVGAGLLWDGTGTAAYVTAALLSLLAWGLVWRWLRVV